MSAGTHKQKHGPFILTTTLGGSYFPEFNEASRIAFKFRSRLPFGHLRSVRHAIPDQEVKLAILDRTAEVPVGLNHITRLVGSSFAVYSWRFCRPHPAGFSHEIDPCVGIKRRNTDLRKAEVVDR